MLRRLCVRVRQSGENATNKCCVLQNHHVLIGGLAEWLGIALNQIEVLDLRPHDVSTSETATNANSAKAAAMTKSYRSRLIFRIMMPTPVFVPL